MFRLLRVIIRPSSELIQDYLIPSALWDPVALTIVGAIVLWVHVCYYSDMVTYVIIQGGSNMTGTDLCKQAALRSSCATSRE